jgi:hypothetical protein
MGRSNLLDQVRELFMEKVNYDVPNGNSMWKVFKAESTDVYFFLVGRKGRKIMIYHDFPEKELEVQVISSSKSLNLLIMVRKLLNGL